MKENCKICGEEDFNNCTCKYEPKFPKAGPKVKTSKIKNRPTRLHDIPVPKEKYCRRCGKTTETERFAHYEGFRKSIIGKGLGVKCNDNFTAWICQECTDIMDVKPDTLLMFEHSEEWLWLICKTHLI
jgi:hypothetical protein